MKGRKWFRLFSIALCLVLIGCSSQPAYVKEYETTYKDYDSMADLMQKHGLIFGTCYNPGCLRDEDYMDLVKRHFNSLTCTNEMKAYSLLDQNASIKSTDGMPVMNYTTADEMLDYAAEEGIKVRGHVLVWDAYMCDWFFREGYQSDGAYVDRATLLSRLEYYITEVVTHFEEKYPGVVYCWDVVNEAVGDNDKEYDVNDRRHIRTIRDQNPNRFKEIIGDDYVEQSFLFARNVVDSLNANIDLYYNDFNAFQTVKCDAICNLIDDINHFDIDASGEPRKLCDGVGMQGYIGGYGTQEGCLDKNILKLIEQAIKKYGELGVKIQFTEMSVRNFNGDAESRKKHAEFCKDLFDMILRLKVKENQPIDGVILWTILDEPDYEPGTYNYSLCSTYGGLFTKDYRAKDSFILIHDLAKNYE